MWGADSTSLAIRSPAASEGAGAGKETSLAGPPDGGRGSIRRKRSLCWRASWAAIIARLGVPESTSGTLRPGGRPPCRGNIPPWPDWAGEALPPVQPSPRGVGRPRGSPPRRPWRTSSPLPPRLWRYRRFHAGERHRMRLSSRRARIRCRWSCPNNVNFAIFSAINSTLSYSSAAALAFA